MVSLHRDRSGVRQTRPGRRQGAAGRKGKKTSSEIHGHGTNHRYINNRTIRGRGRTACRKLKNSVDTVHKNIYTLMGFARMTSKNPKNIEFASFKNSFILSILNLKWILPPY